MILIDETMTNNAPIFRGGLSIQAEIRLNYTALRRRRESDTLSGEQAGLYQSALINAAGTVQFNTCYRQPLVF